MDLSVPSQFIYLFKLRILIPQEEWVYLILVFLVIHIKIVPPLLAVGWYRFWNFIYDIHSFNSIIILFYLKIIIFKRLIIVQKIYNN